MCRIDLFEILRRQQAANRINLEVKPEIVREAITNQQAILSALPGIIAFEYSSPGFFLQLDSLQFSNGQLFRTESAAHLRGAVDLVINRQHWRFEGFDRLANQRGVSKITLKDKYSELGRSISRGLGLGHLIIVEWVEHNGTQFDQQWRNGEIVKDWYNNSQKGGADATHIHIQPDSRNKEWAEVVEAEANFFRTRNELNKSETNLRKAEQSFQDAVSSLNISMQEVKFAEAQVKESENSRRQEAQQRHEKAVKGEREAKDREEKARAERDKLAEERKRNEEKAEQARKKRASIKIPDPARRMDDPDHPTLSFFEVILIVLKAGTSALPEDFTKEDAFDFYKNLLKELKEMQANTVRLLDPFNRFEWFGEDPTDVKRYLNEVLRYLNPKTVADPSLGNLPWCGTSFVNNIESTIILNSKIY